MTQANVARLWVELLPGELKTAVAAVEQERTEVIRAAVREPGAHRDDARRIARVWLMSSINPRDSAQGALRQ